MSQIILPAFHAGQADSWKSRSQFYALKCGRRWGKTQMLQAIACAYAAKGQNIGWFTPNYKIQAEAFAEIAEILDPIKKSASETKGVFRTTTGGRIDFWTLENPRAGRSRKYHWAIIDEAAFTKANMMEIWERAISPALWDYQGSAIAASTPNGKDDDNFFYKICADPAFGFTSYTAPSWSNPHVPAQRAGESDESHQARRAAHWANIKAKSHPLVHRQETEAEFVDWSGEAFFALEKWLYDGQPVAYPHRCDAVFAVIDTAVKDGKEHDGTAIVYYSQSQLVGFPLLILDYDLIQIEGSLLETWLPTVYRRLDELAEQCGARHGHLGAFIEDKASGTILLQQAARREWPATAIDSKLTALGKDERAISVSGYHHQGLCKVTHYAYDKLVTFKGVTRNHLLSQVMGYRIGDKDAHKRADDLADCYMYGLSLALGNRDGY
jgi:hypothetical protein